MESADQILGSINKGIQQQFKKEAFLPKYIAEQSADINANLTEFMYIREVLKNNVIWGIKNVATYKFTMRNYFAPFIVMFVDKCDIGSPVTFPILITYAILSPKYIAREVSWSYKVRWISKDEADDTAQKMLYRLNNEYPSLDRQYQDLLTGAKGKDTYTYFYKDEEIGTEGKKKFKLNIEKFLEYPLLIRGVDTPDGQLTSVVLFSYFLMPKAKNYEGFLDLYPMIKLFDSIITNLSQFFLESDDEQAVRQEQAQMEKEQARKSELNKCPKCGWLLSAGKTKCPICGTEASDQALKATDFSASLALDGVEQRRKTEYFLTSIDSVLDTFDEETEIAQKAFLDSYEKMLNTDEDASTLISDIMRDTDFIRQNFGVLLKGLNDELKFELIPLKYYKFTAQELMFPTLVAVLSFIKEEYSNYHVPIISYLTICPVMPSKIQLIARYDSEAKKKTFEWTKGGEDFGLCRRLNMIKFMEFVNDVFGGENQKYASHFQAMKEDLIGRIVPVEGMEYELPFLISVKPLSENKLPDKNLLILHHFIKSKAEKYIGNIPVSKIMVLIDAVIAGIDLVLPKEAPPEPEGEKKTPAPPQPTATYTESIFDSSDEPELDFSKLDASESAAATSAPQSEISAPRQVQFAAPPQTMPLPPSPQISQAAEIDANDDFISQCLEAELNPRMKPEEMAQKLQEINYQKESMQDMLAQLVAAVKAKQIDFQAYAQQEQQIQQYLVKFNRQLELIEKMKQP
jgi:hypothetical protein